MYFLPIRSILLTDDPLFSGINDPDGADDLFGTDDDGLGLTDASPALNAGDPSTDLSLFPGGPDNPLDLADNPRVFDLNGDGIIDIGAYEFQEELLSITPDGDNILYVDQNVAGGNGSGNSWANAIPELRDALDWAANDWDGSDPPLQIWVADGLYLPTGDDSNRDAAFQLVNNVEIYGGFDGGGSEDELSDRDVEGNPTILSGDIDGDDELFEPGVDSDSDSTTPTQTDHIVGGNSYSVVRAGNDINDTAHLDGFTILSGNADTTTSPATRQRGGGLHNEGNPILSSLTFIGNNAFSGGGIFSNSNFSLTQSTFRANSATGNSSTSGGGVSSFSSNPELTHVNFINNYASFGGGFDNLNGSPILKNVSFSGNKAVSSGGGIFNRFSASKATSDVANSSVSTSAPELINVAIIENTAGSGGGIYNDSGTPVVLSTTIFGNMADSDDGGGIFNLDGSNPTLTNSIVWGNMVDGSGNEIFNDGSSAVTLDFSLYRDRDSESDIVEGGGFTATSSLTDDPLFVDESDPDGVDDTIGTADDGLSLQSASPAINAGAGQTNLSLFPGGPDNPLALAGNPRMFDGDIGIIDIGAYEFQGEQELPEADDNRILLANNETHTFTPADFGQADNSFFVAIDDLPGGFDGELELDGIGPVSPGSNILVGDINNGDLTYTPPAGVFGFGYDIFEFSIEDDLGNPSAESFTMSLDVAATSVDLDFDGEGWRFLASPADGETVGNFFGPIWTQGFPGSDSPGAEFANIQMLNQEAYEWEPVGSDGTILDAGDPVIAFVFSDDDNNGTPDPFPKTLSNSTMTWDPLDGSFGGEQFYDPAQQTTDDSFLLMGNPHPVAVDFCQTNRDDVADNAYLWDPSVSGGNGDYVNLSCSGGDDVEIAPFQSFWLRVTDPSNNFGIPTAAYLDGTTSGFFKASEPSDDFVVSLTVRNTEEAFTNTTRVLFDEEASNGPDLMDAPKLSPAGLASNYLSFYSLDQELRAYALQALPEGAPGLEEKLRIPLDIQTTESGLFTLEWRLPETHVFNGSYFLRDNRTSEVIELRGGSVYSFEITEEDAIQTKQAEATHPMSEIAGTGVAALNTHRMNSKASPRFELLIATAGVDGLTELGAVPEEFELAQNYPNPFNPTTVISYQLPVSSQVRLTVYDMLGRQVATLVDGQVAAGRHQVSFNADNLSSGVYLYRLQIRGGQVGSAIMTRKLTVVK